MDNKANNTLLTLPEKGETVPLLLEGLGRKKN